jgi:hypothetical protein
MNPTLHLVKDRRVVPLRWKRAITGHPHGDFPDIDDRGTRAPEYAPVVGMTAGRAATVRLEREMIAADAPLFVTSSDEEVVAIEDPADRPLPPGSVADVRIRALAGGAPRQADVQIRFGSMQGPVVSRLVVNSWEAIEVTISPHLVTTEGYPGTKIGTQIDWRACLAMAQGIWWPAGIQFKVGKPSRILKQVTYAGIVDKIGDGVMLLRTHHVPHTVNVYFVPAFEDDVLLGWGPGPLERYERGSSPPGVIVADRTISTPHSPETIGQVLAHEIGHFFGLLHTDRREELHKVGRDRWARRMLMHNYAPMFLWEDWHDDIGYGRTPGGARMPGSLISQKRLPGISTDPEAPIARKLAGKDELF